MLSGLVSQFEEVLSNYSDSRSTIEGYPWYNKVFRGPNFRWAHVEHYYHRTADIVHVVVMPNGWDEYGIFGYDVILINGKPTGLFMDVTPTVRPMPTFAVDEEIGQLRTIPEWANFSENFVCVQPELETIDVGVKVLSEYMPNLGIYAGPPEEILLRQQEYINMQRSNDKTYKMLASHIGSDKAREFIDNILFPNVL